MNKSKVGVIEFDPVPEIYTTELHEVKAYHPNTSTTLEYIVRVKKHGSTVEEVELISRLCNTGAISYDESFLVHEDVLNAFYKEYPQYKIDK